MCGIVAYTGRRSARTAVRAGLGRLEYRGYDSTGIGIVTPDGGIERVRAVGGVDALDHELRTRTPSDGRVGIGHTRWATHGEVSEANAHPFTGCTGRVLVALNGIIENHDELRDELIAAGHEFESTTDAEVVAHLIEHAPAAELQPATAVAARRLRGHFSFVVAHVDRPDVVVGHRNRCPLVVLRGEDWSVLASSSFAACTASSWLTHLEDGDTVAAELGTVAVVDAGGAVVERPERRHDDIGAAIGTGDHESFMRKEMLEQPDAIRDTVESARADARRLPAGVRRVVLTGCGTSHHAALAGRTMIERWAGLPCSVEVAAEWPDRLPLGPDVLVLALTQSGETADTIRAIRNAAGQGAATCAITNVADSLVAREAANVVRTSAGVEIGVAATKTFAAQLTALATVAVHLGERNGHLPAGDAGRVLCRLTATADDVRTVLDGCDAIERIAKLLADAPYAMYLGRGESLPVALEGALKIKEIAYLPVEATSAGEMKHGPIALVEHEIPVVMVLPDGPDFEKALANLHEVHTRGADVIAVTTRDDQRIRGLARETIELPPAHAAFSALVTTVALQLLAYYAACHRGHDPDRPRNLAKTVTVE